MTLVNADIATSAPPGGETSPKELPYFYTNTELIDEKLYSSLRNPHNLKSQANILGPEAAIQRYSISAKSKVRTHVEKILRDFQTHNRTQATGETRESSVMRKSGRPS